ncbi:MAG: ccmH [Ilumatobacteraceae bacterium]|nr:ccmH [Ilumatobacteraceae bacterium]
MASAGWKRAKRWPGWVLLAVVVVGLMAIGLGTNNTPATAQDRVDSIAKRLACPICDGESVFESRNTASDKIRTEIRAQVDEGQLSNDEIISYFVQRNQRLLLVPRASGLDALVWELPAFAAVCAIAGLAFAFRRWKRAADTVPTDDDRALVAAARSSLTTEDDDDHQS